MINRLRIGQQAERRAEKYLRQHGLRTLLRNWRCRGGELDLVCEQNDSLVVVEVRQRTNTDFGDAVETVDQNKQRRLIHATQAMLQRYPDWQDRPLRFDVIGITGRQITWIQDAFEA